MARYPRGSSESSGNRTKMNPVKGLSTAQDPRAKTNKKSKLTKKLKDRIRRRG